MESRGESGWNCHDRRKGERRKGSEEGGQRGGIQEGGQLEDFASGLGGARDRAIGGELGAELVERVGRVSMS